MLLYGDLIGAQDALSKGLLNRVVPAADLEKEARQWAVVLAEKSPIAFKSPKGVL